ncbi:MAG: rubrerythrin [Glaciecola sp.]|jgi:rubrerythrin
MTLDHPKLIKLLQKAYSAEKAAAFAYMGHANSIKKLEDKAPINQIEQDEWEHRREVLSIMQEYDVPVSKFEEFKFHIIGKFIAFSCHVIGWFMPYFFAGKLESGNVCEYFVMLDYFNDLGITKHNQMLYDMGMKEKDHEVFFMQVCQKSKWLPYFEKIFRWGENISLNDVDLEKKYPVDESGRYCKRSK